MKSLFVIVLSLSLAGCVAVWGNSYNVASSNSRSVTVEFDPLLVNMGAVMNAAQSECAKYGKDAVLDSSTEGNIGVTVNTYRCETRVADKVIDVQN